MLPTDKRDGLFEVRTKSGIPSNVKVYRKEYRD